MSESHERRAPRETIELQNVVASAGIEQELDLQSVVMDLEGADYDPENFPGIVYRTEAPRAATLLFRSGKMVSTGASSTEDVHAALDGVFDDLRELGIEIADEPEVTVQNMVASADLGQRLNLNAIAIGVGLENIEYEPEQFPGLVYRLDDPPVVVLLFGSGKPLSRVAPRARWSSVQSRWSSHSSSISTYLSRATSAFVLHCTVRRRAIRRHSPHRRRRGIFYRTPRGR